MAQQCVGTNILDGNYQIKGEGLLFSNARIVRYLPNGNPDSRDFTGFSCEALGSGTNRICYNAKPSIGTLCKTYEDPEGKEVAGIPLGDLAGKCNAAARRNGYSANF